MARKSVTKLKAVHGPACYAVKVGEGAYLLADQSTPKGESVASLRKAFPGMPIYQFVYETGTPSWLRVPDDKEEA